MWYKEQGHGLFSAHIMRPRDKHLHREEEEEEEERRAERRGAPWSSALFYADELIRCHFFAKHLYYNSVHVITTHDIHHKHHRGWAIQYVGPELSQRSPLTGMLFIKIISNCCSFALLLSPTLLWQIQVIITLWYNLSKWVVNLREIHSAAWWHGLWNSTIPLPPLPKKMCSHCVGASSHGRFGPGQSLKRGWLLQGSTPSDAKAAWGLNGSQPQHKNMETSFTQLCVYCKTCLT